MKIWIAYLKDNRNNGLDLTDLKFYICMHLQIIAMGWYGNESAERINAEKRLNDMKKRRLCVD